MLARSTYRKVRDRASYAFALVSVAAALEIKDGTIARRAARLRRRRAQALACLKAEAALQGKPATPRSFLAAAEAELADARPLHAQRIQSGTRQAHHRSRAAGAGGGTRMSIKEAVAKAAMQKAVEVAPDAWMPGGNPDPLIRHKHGLIGDPVPASMARSRSPARRLSPPSSPCTDGLRRPRIQHHPRGRIATLDTAAAAAAPGVVLVMTYENAPRLKPTPIFKSSPKAAGRPRPAHPAGRPVHWNGEPIAVVLAETQEQADYAKSLIHATYEEEPAISRL